MEIFIDYLFINTWKFSTIFFGSVLVEEHGNRIWIKFPREKNGQEALSYCWTQHKSEWCIIVCFDFSFLI